MIDQNKKRYVYLDKYLHYQSYIEAQLKAINNRLHFLTIIVMVSIGLLTAVLYKIFG